MNPDNKQWLLLAKRLRDENMTVNQVKAALFWRTGKDFYKNTYSKAHDPNPVWLFLYESNHLGIYHLPYKPIDYLIAFLRYKASYLFLNRIRFV